MFNEIPLAARLAAHCGQPKAKIEAVAPQQELIDAAALLALRMRADFEALVNLTWLIDAPELQASINAVDDAHRAFETLAGELAVASSD